MDTNKETRFWEIEKELRETLLLMNVQLEVTHQALSAQMPKLQEQFRHFAQLGEELGFNMDSLDVKKFYDLISNNKLFQAKNLLRNDMED